MTGIHIENIEALRLLVLIPVLLALYIYAGQRRRAALARFVASGIIGRISFAVSHNARRWKAGISLLAITLIILGLTRPAWNPAPLVVQREGRDVVFLLDVSKSMLAADLYPNRLEKAKLAIRDCVDRLQGDRVGLVVFAGSSVLKCPLTVDYGFFRMMLDDVSVDSIQQGGTKVGDAVRMITSEVFDDQTKQFKDVIIITDGGDQESYPAQAAESAGEEGVRLIILGLGDDREGARIPAMNEFGTKTFFRYEGQEVWSKLEAGVLRDMAAASPGGRYFHVATGAIDLGDVYLDLIADAEKKALEEQSLERYEEKFQVFLIAAFLLLCAEMLIGERKRKGAVNGQ